MRGKDQGLRGNHCYPHDDAYGTGHCKGHGHGGKGGRIQGAHAPGHRQPEKVTDASVEWYKRIKDEFLPAKRVIVVGYDGMYCDVLEGALKILETVRQGVAGYDIEEFFHGIYNSITDSAHIFYLASRGDYKPRTMKLVGILSEWTPHNYLIASPDGVDVQSGKNLIVEFVEDPMFSCWEYIIPLQVVACMAPQDLGINPDIPKDPEFHKRIGSKKLDGVRDHYVAQEDTFLKTAVLEK